MRLVGGRQAFSAGARVGGSQAFSAGSRVDAANCEVEVGVGVEIELVESRNSIDPQ